MKNQTIKPAVQPMKAPGHSIVLCIKTQFPETRITLECSCGEVLHGGLFVVDDERHRYHIRSEGHAAALAHLEGVR